MKKNKLITLRDPEIKLLSKLGTFLIDLYNYRLVSMSEGERPTITLEMFQELEQYADKLDDMIAGIQMDIKLKLMEEQYEIKKENN